MKTVHLLLTRRRDMWRVRILSGGVIRWKCYRAAEYPTPEDVVRRCMAGLVACRAPDDEAESYEMSSTNECFSPTHDSPLRVRWEFQLSIFSAGGGEVR